MRQSTERDFDFLIGHWRVLHSRLQERLVGSNEWQVFDGTCSMRVILGGKGNIDDNILNLPGGTYRAASLRVFDAGARRWAIWWIDDRHPHTIDAPVVGEFDGSQGTFYADDNFNGRPVRVRFRWTGTRTTSPLWEQAFSPDAGRTWEVNWTMTFTRCPKQA